MAIPRNRERNLKRLRNQLKGVKDNERLTKNLEQRILTLEKTKG